MRAAACTLVMSLWMFGAAGCARSPDPGPPRPAREEAHAAAAAADASTPRERAEALGRRLLAEVRSALGPPADGEPPDFSSDEARAAARDVLARLDPDGALRVPLLLLAWVEGGPLHEMLEPYHALCALGMNALPGLLAALDGPRGDARAFAIWRLDDLTAAAARIVPLLLPIAADAADPQRVDAIRALVALVPGRSGLLELLVAATGSANLLLETPGRGSTVELAGVWPGLIPQLVRQFGADDPETRRATARALPYLETLLRDPDEGLRQAAAAALAEAGGGGSEVSGRSGR
jgi:HEAT repeat protein